MKRVVIVGSGNLAEALARAISRNDALELVQVFARNPERGRAVAALAATAWTSDSASLAPAEVYLIAVSDKAVGAVASSLPFPAEAIVAHTAGSVPLEAIPARFRRRAVFYPLQTFTAGRDVDFTPIPLFLETAEAYYPDLERFARTLSRTVLRADSQRRARIHLAGVFACNFANHMFALGERIVRDAGLEFAVLKPLIAETAAKALDAASPAEVQTGPAVRNDSATKARHGELLAFDRCLKNLYDTISQNIWETSRKR